MCIALAGARATGKSIYLGVVVQQLGEMAARAGEAFTFADETSRSQYELNYERPLFQARGIMGSTGRANTQDGYARDPMILEIGQIRGRRIYIVLRDVAGEDLEAPAPDTTYLQYFQRADAVLFIFDPTAVPEVRELLRDHLPDQLSQVGSPERVLENVLRLIGPAPTPIGMVLSKFDTLHRLSSVQDQKWRLVMSNAGAAFNRDTGIYATRFDRGDGELLHEEVKSLLYLLNARKFVNGVEAPAAGQRRLTQFFAVSALGEAAVGSALHLRGIAPFRCLDPIRWAMDRQLN